jgi:hypothetical protein
MGMQPQLFKRFNASPERNTFKSVAEAFPGFFQQDARAAIQRGQTFLHSLPEFPTRKWRLISMASGGSFSATSIIEDFRRLPKAARRSIFKRWQRTF